MSPLPPSEHRPGGVRLSRRTVVQVGAAALAAQTAGIATAQPAAPRPQPITPSSDTMPTTMPVRLNVNGRGHTISVDLRTSVLDALRENLMLKGTEKGCDHGQCGACTVLIDGQRINSCLTLAVMHDGQAIITIEGLAHGDAGRVHQTRRLPVRLLHAGADRSGSPGSSWAPWRPTACAGSRCHG